VTFAESPPLLPRQITHLFRLNPNSIRKPLQGDISIEEKKGHHHGRAEQALTPPNLPAAKLARPNHVNFSNAPHLQRSIILGEFTAECLTEIEACIFEGRNKIDPFNTQRRCCFYPRIDTAVSSV
jgi:hypothetical protein